MCPWWGWASSATPAHAEVARRLETELSQEIMRSVQRSMDDRLAQSGDMSQDPAFGKEGWQRPWPHPPRG